MKNQTAVEWLVEKLNQCESWNFLGDEYYEETFKKENNVR